MDLGLQGKVALVTGGSSGIGRSCAIELAREGALVSFVGRDRERLDETQRMIEAVGGTGQAVQADLSTAEGCRNAFDACIERFGTVDVLVNNAGATQRAQVLDMPIEVLQAGLELKLYAAIRMSQLAIPVMRAKRWGRIVMVSGAAGTSPTPDSLTASMTNIGMLNLSRALTDEVAGDNILVNSVCPGNTNTPRAEVRFRAAMARTGKTMDEV
ncbi:MAG TPA: SDR family NAD(P)-dependent oxidoreductase, partial [Burkholderiales bacterium]|nr:SDR family NAD(P)-dependent oxidoreductase [Burkholderiales bacterium]